MKKPHLMLVAAFVAALVLVSPAAAQQPGTEASGASGGLKLTVHTHSAGTLLFPSDRLSFDFVEGEEFAYSSRPCGGPAPFNDLGLDFSPDYPGVDDDDDGTAPVRHQVEGAITGVNGDKGTVEGKVTSVLCVPEDGAQVESGNVIVTHFDAEYRRASDNQVPISGQFEISPTESTGTFEDLEGHGSIQGILTCLAHQRDPSQPTCAELGEFTDFVGVRGDPTKGPGEIVPGLVGSFRDTTVQPV